MNAFRVRSIEIEELEYILAGEPLAAPQTASGRATWVGRYLPARSVFLHDSRNVFDSTVGGDFLNDVLVGRSEADRDQVVGKFFELVRAVLQASLQQLKARTRTHESDHLSIREQFLDDGAHLGKDGRKSAGIRAAKALVRRNRLSGPKGANGIPYSKR